MVTWLGLFTIAHTETLIDPWQSLCPSYNSWNGPYWNSNRSMIAPIIQLQSTSMHAYPQNTLHFIAHFIFNLQLTKSYLEKMRLVLESLWLQNQEKDMKLALESSLWLQMSMTLESFWIRLSKKSPCLIVDWYKAFFASGRLVSKIPATLSILQLSLPAAMNRESSESKNGMLTPNDFAMASIVTLL